MKLTTPINITAGQEYRLWYGEDFKNVSEGNVTCDPRFQLSNWGCPANLLTILTDKENNRLAQQKSYIILWVWLAYTLPKYDSFSPKVELDLIKLINVTAGQEFRLWYGEDLKNAHEHDNSGTTCAHVYMYGVY
ncbi:hypothetical protein AC249_AIPGENE8923 [Exaiptasia diaphana]|nr:hypothetical protein AC249_AIPGENE8923 [Exaiptasia diaphana]